MPRRTPRTVPRSPTAARKQSKRRATINLTDLRGAAKRQRNSLARATSRTSKYFAASSADEFEDVNKPRRHRETPQPFDWKSIDRSESAGWATLSEASHDDDDDDEPEQKPKKKGGWGWQHGRKRKTAAEDVEKGKELWREGVRTGLGPGKEVFIKLPKARDPGDTPYENDTIHPNTLLFLKDLKENNEREWLKAHDADYRTAKKDWETFVVALTQKIIEEDSTIPELPIKDVVYRIYRDVRFSNDPTPYKPFFAAAWSRDGRKGAYAAYYLHLEPGQCHVSSGLWDPDAPRLALMRDEIHQDPDALKSVLLDRNIRREIFNGIRNDENEAVKAFASQNKAKALKTKPKGYNADHPDVQLLRLRNFTMGKKLGDSDFLGPEAQDLIADIVGVMVPFVSPTSPPPVFLFPLWFRLSHEESGPVRLCRLVLLSSPTTSNPISRYEHSRFCVTYLNSVVRPDPEASETSGTENEDVVMPDPPHNERSNFANEKKELGKPPQDELSSSEDESDDFAPNFGPHRRW
ncbi:hypothetical protein AJ80_08632 [Polytolypa hystricis UAMH7299]|uniref:Uncharacterized protein n=1 Tax=Polytolypa hystricis (strain UAMH7299) TaxID=1447883 RepID=A0A2B7X4K5_POLH7|nr:hypothetical protein AJ80_08632 [Polytolypa hystricis UAMH7299]